MERGANLDLELQTPSNLPLEEGGVGSGEGKIGRVV
jgi:hypothetical protein